MRLSDVIVEASQAALSEQRADGSFPPGCNGPYSDPETPVRNTAHWLITMLAAQSIAGDSSFATAAAGAADYLCRPAARPHGAAFLCRTNPKKDLCNGLIGQAWVIESLAEAGEQLLDERLRRLAGEVFALHFFDEEVGIWRRLHVDGRGGDFDLNFNHQLWFAAAAALIDNDPSGLIGARVMRFLNRAHDTYFRVAPSGRILHQFDPPYAGESVRPRAPLTATEMAHKEIGYHAFNLYAFALLASRFPAHPLWASDGLRAALEFVDSDQYLNGLEDNRYAYSYNPAGFEVAFALQVFGAAPRHAERSDGWWVARQLERNGVGLTRDEPATGGDRTTTAARLYEATRLRDLEIPLVSGKRGGGVDACRAAGQTA